MRLLQGLLCCFVLTTGLWASGLHAAGVAKPAKPKITLQPISRAIDVGDTVTFTVAASSSVSVTYQWRFNGQAISSLSNATAQTPTLSLTPTGTASEGRYDVVVTNAAGSVTSKPASLTVNLAPDSLPVGTNLHADVTFFYAGQTISDSGDFDVSGATTMTDPDDSTGSYTFVYQRLPKNHGRLTITGSYYDTDLGAQIRVNMVYTLIFTEVTSEGAISATFTGPSTLTPPAGYRPSKLTLKTQGTMLITIP
jgi:hypothetical protein